MLYQVESTVARVVQTSYLASYETTSRQAGIQRKAKTPVRHDEKQRRTSCEYKERFAINRRRQSLLPYRRSLVARPPSPLAHSMEALRYGGEPRVRARRGGRQRTPPRRGTRHERGRNPSPPRKKKNRGRNRVPATAESSSRAGKKQWMMDGSLPPPGREGTCVPARRTRVLRVFPFRPSFLE